MRILAWNANYNNRRRSFLENVSITEHLHADIVILSETALPLDEKSATVQLIGCQAPGLAILANNGFELKPYVTNEDAPSLVGGWTVNGRVNFDILAAWPVEVPGESYHKILMRSLERLREVGGAANKILAGDLNTSARVVSQRTTHQKFLEQAKKLGLVSTYHEQTGESHGDETVSTFRRGSGYHLDYCFASQHLIPSTNVSILRAGVWPTLSDHFPVLVDIPDAAFVR